MWRWFFNTCDNVFGAARNAFGRIGGALRSGSIGGYCREAGDIVGDFFDDLCD